MQPFYTIKDSDIFDSPEPEPVNYIDRPTVKGVVFNSDNKIAMLSNIKGYSLFPGGGVEEGETKEEALIRECVEEIGCEVEIISEIGMATQFRAKDKRKFDTYFFTAKVKGETSKPTTTQEDELAVTINWFTEEEVKNILENQIDKIPIDYYQAQFNSRTHLEAFRKYLEKK